MMSDSAFSHRELESRLYKILRAARFDYVAAVVERFKLAGDPSKREGPDKVLTRRQALDHEQHSLENYIRAFRQYNDFVTDGKFPDGDQSKIGGDRAFSKPPS